MSSEGDQEASLESTAAEVGYYGTVAYGAGYLLLLMGIPLFLLELSSWNLGIATSSSTSGASSPAGLPWVLLLAFLAWVSAIIFSGQIITRGSKIQGNIKDMRISSLPINSFSLFLVFGGSIGIIVSTWISSFGILSPRELLFPSVICIAGAILLMIGPNVFSKNPTESKWIGSILTSIAFIFIYFGALAPLRDYWSDLSLQVRDLVRASGVSMRAVMPPFPGPLLSEFNLEVVTWLLALACSFLLAIPYLSKGPRKPYLKAAISLVPLSFSLGLIYFNWYALAWLIGLVSMGGTSTPGTLWIVILGFLTLMIAGIVILISSGAYMAASLKTVLAKTHPSTRATKYCAKCGAEISEEAAFCPKCGKKQG